MNDILQNEPGAGINATDVICWNKDHVRFTDEIIRKSGVNIHLCWHCKACSGGCPFSKDMDYLPNQIIRLVQMGLKETVLKSSAIWICAGCHTCSTQCPQAIDMAAVMDSLKHTAIKEGIKPAEPHILNFHEAVMASIHRHGRAHKLEIMMRYKLSTKDWFSDLDVGLKMLQNRKLDLMPSRVDRIDEIERLFKLGKESNDAECVS